MLNLPQSNMSNNISFQFYDTKYAKKNKTTLLTFHSKTQSVRHNFRSQRTMQSLAANKKEERERGHTPARRRETQLP